MTFWLTALLVWIAAGARVGRVLVKPATTPRVAIVVAVAAVALAVTVAIPEVGLAVDHALPRGLPSGVLHDGVVAAAWVLFTTATSVVAAAAWPVVHRRNLRHIGAGLYGVGAVAILGTLFFTRELGWAVTVLGGVFIVITGIRNLSWTPLGRGIAGYIAGTAIVVALATIDVVREFGVPPAHEYGKPGWAWQIWQLAALLIASGAVWIVVETWWRARILLRRTKDLHLIMVERFPEVVQEASRRSTYLAASDRVAQIMDAFYLQSGGGVEIVSAGQPPKSLGDHALRLAQWVADPLESKPVDARWIAPPQGMSARRWVGIVAQTLAARSDLPVRRVQTAVKR